MADFPMPVGSTGLVFVAALQGTATLAGPPDFPQLAQDAAYLRAATTLARMGIVSGATFAFIRQAIGYTQAEAATFLEVTESDVANWETGITPVPVENWRDLAAEACRLDSRPPLQHLALFTAIPARTIRITVDIPQVSNAGTPSVVC